jgi:hypothetical protein
MELIDVLQAILDKAGNKEFYIEGSIDKEDGEIRGASIRLCKVYKPEVAKEAGPTSYDNDRAGTVNIRETKETETTVSKSKAAEIKKNLKIGG